MKNQALKKMLANKLVMSSSDELTILTPEELHVLQGTGCGTNSCFVKIGGGGGSGGGSCTNNSCTIKTGGS